MRILGLVFVALLLALALLVHQYYFTILDGVAALGLGGLRDWLADLRWPVYGVAAALALSAAEWLWQRGQPKH